MLYLSRGPPCKGCVAFVLPYQLLALLFPGAVGEEGWGFDQTSDQIPYHLDRSGDQIPSYNPCSGQGIIYGDLIFLMHLKEKIRFKN